MTDEVRPSRRAAFVVASGHHDDPLLQDVPAALNSADRISRLLADPDTINDRFDTVRHVPDPVFATDVLLPLADVATAAQEVLLFYFSGHGLLTPRGDLCLSTSRTIQARPEFTTIPFEHVAQLFRESPARIKIIILDCCFAGRATNALAAPEIAALSDVEGVHTLAATTRNRPAHVPTPTSDGDPQLTSFTHELLSLIEEGLPGASEFLSLNDLFPHLGLRLAQKGLPRPSQAISDGAASFPLFRNAAFLPIDSLVAASDAVPETDDPSAPASSGRGPVTVAVGKARRPRVLTARLHLIRLGLVPATACLSPLAIALTVLSAEETMRRLTVLSAESEVPVSVLFPAACALAMSLALWMTVHVLVPLLRPWVVLAEPADTPGRPRRARLHVTRLSSAELVLAACGAAALAAPLNPHLLRDGPAPFLPYLVCFAVVVTMTVGLSNATGVERRRRPAIQLTELDADRSVRRANLVVSRFRTVQVALAGGLALLCLLILTGLLREEVPPAYADLLPFAVGLGTIVLTGAAVAVFNQVAESFDGLALSLTDRTRSGSTPPR